MPAHYGPLFFLLALPGLIGPMMVIDFAVALLRARIVPAWFTGVLTAGAILFVVGWFTPLVVTALAFGLMLVSLGWLGMQPSQRLARPSHLSAAT